MKLREHLTLQFFLYYIILISYTIGMTFLFDGNFCNTTNNKDDSIPEFQTIFIRYSLGAFFETFFLSFLIILLLKLIPFFRKNFLYLLLFSTIPFALLHYKCFTYIVVVYPAGIILNLYYLLIYKKTNSHPISISIVSLLHFSVNTSTYIIAMLLGKI